MDHSEAVQQMAAERYLLDELPTELRDAFEEHLFDCPECTLDLRTEAAFLDEAKLQLPGLTAAPSTHLAGRVAKPAVRQVTDKRDWLGWLRPMFANPLIAGPVFAALLVLVGYQNFVTYPELRAALNEPRLMPVIPLHAARSAAHAVYEIDHKQGIEFQIDLSDDATYSSYNCSLKDAQGKLVWTSASVAASGAEAGALSVDIPGTNLKQGTYTLTVFGIAADGQSNKIEQHSFDIHFKD